MALINGAVGGGETIPPPTTGSISSITSTGGSITVTNPGGPTTNIEVATGKYLPLTGGTMSGAIAMGASKITGLANGSGAQDAAAFGQIPTSASTIGGLLAANNLSDVASAATSRTNLAVLGTAGGTMSGAIAMGASKITGLANGTVATDAAAFGQITAANAGALALTGGTMSGAIAMGANKITGLANGSGAQDAAAFGQIPTNLPSKSSISSAGSGTMASNASYVNLSTSAAATITVNTKVKVTLTFQIQVAALAVGHWTGFAVSGANTIAAANNTSAGIFIGFEANQQDSRSLVFYATGLTPGSTTFTIQVQANTAGATWTAAIIEVECLD